MLFDVSVMSVSIYFDFMIRYRQVDLDCIGKVEIGVTGAEGLSVALLVPQVLARLRAARRCPYISLLCVMLVGCSSPRTVLGVYVGICIVFNVWQL